MAKDPSPLLGYNNNIRHKNRVFHVQTEDSGVRHPHIITHLFMDGGRILKSVKTSYAEHLGVDKMADLVRKMMKDQHKGMLIALRDGQFDHVIDGGEAPKPSSSAVAASPPAPPVESAPRLPTPPKEAATLDAIPSPVAPPVAPPSTPALSPASVPRPAPPSQREHLLEPERPAARMGPTFEPAPTDLQPPPANLFRPRTGGNYSALGEPSSAPDSKPPSSVGPLRPPVRPGASRPGVAKPSTVPPGATLSRSSSSRPNPPPVPSAAQRSNPAASPAPPRPAVIRRTSTAPPPPPGPRRPAPAPVVARAQESRYASARPAAIFGQAKPRSGSSIFGEDIISDKSLDEVIMSYLADDAGTKAPEPAKGGSGSSDPKRRK